MFNTAQRTGGAFGVALLTSLAAWRTGDDVSAQALASGYRLAFTAGAGLGAASLLVAVVALRPRRTGAAGPTRSQPAAARPSHPAGR
jgi:hypothetical protein